MLVLIVVFISASAGIAAASIARRWPAADPSAAAARAIARGTAHHGRVARFLRPRMDPAAASGLALTFTLAFVVAAGTVVGILAYLLRTDPGLAAADLRVALWGAGHATSFSTSVFRAVTQLGATLTVVAVGSVVGGAAALRSRRAAPVFFIALVLAGNSAIVNIIKVLVDRARPNVSVLTGFTGRSFPSGHSAAAAACYGAVALVMSMRWSPPRRAIAFGGAAAIAVDVACSRGICWFIGSPTSITPLLGWVGREAYGVILAFGGRWLRVRRSSRRRAHPRACVRGSSGSSVGARL